MRKCPEKKRKEKRECAIYRPACFAAGKQKCEIYEVLTKKCANMCTLIQAPALGLSASSSDSESNATDHNLRPASAPLPRAKSSARPHFPAAMRYLSVADGYYNFIYQSLIINFGFKKMTKTIESSILNPCNLTSYLHTVRGAQSLWWTPPLPRALRWRRSQRRCEPPIFIGAGRWVYGLDFM